MTDRPQDGDSKGQQKARAVLRKALLICVAVSCMAVLALAAAFAAPARSVPAAARPGMLTVGLLVLLFIAATIIGIGIQWTAAIVAARRYTHRNPYPAARAVAVSQCAILALYVAVIGFVLYFRLKAAGTPLALVPAIVSLLAGLYFLRLPDFLSKGLYSAARKDDKDSD